MNTANDQGLTTYDQKIRMTPRDSLPPGIIAQAPCRADLAGGTIDLWPLYLFHPGAMTLNFALSLLTTCRIEPLPGAGYRVSVTAPPHEGQANEAVIAVVADHFRVSRSRVRIVAGRRGRLKVIEIQGKPGRAP